LPGGCGGLRPHRQPGGALLFPPFGRRPPPRRFLPPGRGASGRPRLPLPHGAALPGRQPRGHQDVEARGGPEAAGGSRESLGHQEFFFLGGGSQRWGPHPHPLPSPIPLCVSKSPPVRTKRVTFEDEVGPPGRPLGGDTATEEGKRPGVLTHFNPPVLVPRPCAVPDYVVKYPAIRSGRQREGYRAVFCDQHAEYRELLGEVREARRRLGELEAAAHHALSRTVGVPSGDSGVARVWHEVLRKKRDSAFLEKQRRCRYLQEKLRHIKRQIQDYDRGGTVYF
uniref:Occludin/ELL domain containing 1 n=1 Tax=Anas zonorhyncha TaxID=75864 RepID=A0A8B9UI19_9AVES